MPDYQKAIIYKFCCKDTKIKQIYVGSTCDVEKRLGKHKYNCINPSSPAYNNKFYKFMRDHGGFESWTLIKIMDYPCKNVVELRIQETMIMHLLKATLNTMTPYLSKEDSVKKRNARTCLYNKNRRKNVVKLRKVKENVTNMIIKDWDLLNDESSDIKAFERICGLIDNVLKK